VGSWTGGTGRYREGGWRRRQGAAGTGDAGRWSAGIYALEPTTHNRPHLGKLVELGHPLRARADPRTRGFRHARGGMIGTAAADCPCAGERGPLVHPFSSSGLHTSVAALHTEGCTHGRAPGCPSSARTCTAPCHPCLPSAARCAAMAGGCSACEGQGRQEPDRERPAAAGCCCDAAAHAQTAARPDGPMQSLFAVRAFDSSRSSSERRNPLPCGFRRESPADGAQLWCQVGRKANITCELPGELCQARRRGVTSQELAALHYEKWGPCQPRKWLCGGRQRHLLRM
jgi:hypothetical protein